MTVPGAERCFSFISADDSGGLAVLGQSGHKANF